MSQWSKKMLRWIGAPILVVTFILGSGCVSQQPSSIDAGYVDQWDDGSILRYEDGSQPTPYEKHPKKN